MSMGTQSTILDTKNKMAIYENKIIHRLWRDIGDGKTPLIWGIVLYLPVTLLNIIQPLLIGLAVQRGMISGTVDKIIWFSLLFLLVSFLFSVLDYVQGACVQSAGQKLVLNIRQTAFIKVQKLPMGFLDKTPIGYILTRLTNDAESVAEMFNMGAVQIIGDILFLLGTVAMLFFVDVTLTIYSFIALPVLAIGMYFFRVWTRSAFVRVRGILSSLNSFLHEYLSGLMTVQIANRVKESQREFEKHNREFLVANRQAVFLDAAIYSFVDFVSMAATAMVLWGASAMQAENALKLGVLVAFVEALSRFFQPIREFSNRFSVFQSGLVSLERINQLHDLPEERDDGATLASPFSDRIAFENVSFSYNGEGLAIKNLSFTLKKGQRIAIVGRTGSGKSTIIKLLHRFYDPGQGRILIDGTDIKYLSLGCIRKLISVVPQEAFLFRGSLLDNLSFGRANATEEDLWQALETVQLKSLIQRRGGLGMHVDFRGGNFSLGERQMLSIARAIITDPQVLILDEATAGVDNKTERLLQHATDELLSKRTALIIAHRLSTIKGADIILVFSAGEIVESGSHEELLAKNGYYKSLIEAQERQRHLAV